jgi:hypothetical protein
MQEALADASGATLLPGREREMGVTDQTFSAEGGCLCGAVRYHITSRPLFVHCCHCTRCQRGTGSAFVLNAMIEADRVDLLQGKPVVVPVTAPGGSVHKISRCPTCQVAVWSVYAGAGDKVYFVRVGTLDEADSMPPDIHIFTSTKLPWVELPDDVPAFEEYYSAREQWPRESLERMAALKG